MTRPVSTPRDAQQALQDLGYPIDATGVDGNFGPRSRHALQQFQTDHHLTADGQPGPKSLAALAAAAPPAGQTVERAPDYAAIMAGGTLPMTIAVGYDEDGNDVIQSRAIVDGMLQRGFVRNGDTFERDTTVDGKPLHIAVHYVDRSVKEPKQAFAKGLAGDRVVLYAGHARYGSGPDFDAITSPAENFVIGTAYDAHMRELLKGVPNDLAKTTLSDGYQFIMYDACQTTDYLDEMRSIPKNKTTRNLDLLLTEVPKLWSTSAQDVLATLDGITSRQTAHQLVGNLSAINDGVGYLLDGFGDNP